MYMYTHRYRYRYSDAHLVGGLPSEPTKELVQDAKNCAEVASMARHAPEVQVDCAGDVHMYIYIHMSTHTHTI